MSSDVELREKKSLHHHSINIYFLLAFQMRKITNEKAKTMCGEEEEACANFLTSRRLENRTHVAFPLDFHSLFFPSNLMDSI